MAEEFKITIYGGNGIIHSQGYSNENMGMVVFVDEAGNSNSIRGDSEIISKLIASDLSRSISPSVEISSIRFNFYDGPATSFPKYADGFFGRPVVCAGATFVKPLQLRRRPALAREIREQSPIKDSKGRSIDLLI